MKKHILFIDDDTDELEIFLEAMNKIPGKFKCTYAASPMQAIEMLKYLTPDFIFVDFDLPKMNGLQFLAILKDEDRHRHTQSYLYSNRINDDLSKMAILFGAVGCIEKTNTVGLLEIELRTALLAE